MGFDYSDLMLEVDMDQEFTLRDVLKASVNSIIPIETLGQILRCKWIKEYYDEAESRPFEDEGQIEYLELQFNNDLEDSEDGSAGNLWWHFHGIGKEGVISDDMPEENKKDYPADFRQPYAIELSPLYNLADYKIKVSNDVMIARWGNDQHSSDSMDFTPSIKLIDLLYSVFWELSWFGNPQKRNEQADELKKSCDELDLAKKEGRIDEITVPWENVKESMKNVINGKPVGKEKEDGL